MPLAVGQGEVGVPLVVGQGEVGVPLVVGQGEVGVPLAVGQGEVGGWADTKIAWPLACRKTLVGNGWAISHFLCTKWDEKTVLSPCRASISSRELSVDGRSLAESHDY